MYSVPCKRYVPFRTDLGSAILNTHCRKACQCSMSRPVYRYMVRIAFLWLPPSGLSQWFGPDNVPFTPRWIYSTLSCPEGEFMPLMWSGEIRFGAEMYFGREETVCEVENREGFCSPLKYGCWQSCHCRHFSSTLKFRPEEARWKMEASDMFTRYSHFINCYQTGCSDKFRIYLSKRGNIF